MKRARVIGWLVAWLVRRVLGWAAYWIWLLAPEALAVRRGRLHDALLPHLGFHLFDSGFAEYCRRRRDLDTRGWLK